MPNTHHALKTQTDTQRQHWQKSKVALTLSLTVLLTSGHALAGSTTTYAKVTSVTPIYETLTVKEPYEKCHLEKTLLKQPKRHHSREYSSTTPTIIGALIGGAIGNELGHNKSNKRVGAVAGAILGGSIANDLKHRSSNQHSHNTRRHTSRYVTEEVCETHYDIRHEKQLSAYDVNYAYDGQIYTTVMDTHPGKRIRVAVDVTPIDY
ncbi:glycine zipper 2TM domain-containing protein [Eionea flava]